MKNVLPSFCCLAALLACGESPNRLAFREAHLANTPLCVKPIAIPDRWRENGQPPWQPDSTFDRYDSKGDLLPNADVYIPATEWVDYTGYNVIRDRGLSLVLRPGVGDRIAPSFYYSISLSGTGADSYRS